jgi:hypothetical protein
MIELSDAYKAYFSYENVLNYNMSLICDSLDPDQVCDAMNDLLIALQELNP